MTADNHAPSEPVKIAAGTPVPIYLNGKFLGASPTGVHRVAEEIIIALDQIIAESPSIAIAFDVRLMFPKSVKHALSLTQIYERRAGLFSWIPWEQLDLPHLSANGLCISLCNLGPLAKTNAMTMMHDAQVYSSPASYSAAFRLWYKTIQPLLGKRHRRVLTVSNFSKSELIRYGVAPADKIAVVHNGCDHVLRITPDAAAASRHGLDGTPFVLALSNTQHHKNIGLLLNAFSRPDLSGVTLALFGSAGRADFEALNFHVPDNVRFLGRISDGELAALMPKATAFACPSLTEGFGLPPLEAMLMGCPAIAAPCGALPEVCGEAALMADPYMPDAWAAHILRLNSDPSLRDEMRARGLAQAFKFTWKNAAMQLLENICVVTGIPMPVLAPGKKTRISLVMSTLGRTTEVKTFLENLKVGHNQELEVIIVDENDTIDLAPILNSQDWQFELIHKKVPGTKGLSRGRNIGIGLATGEIICFPDDDCIYPPRLLGDVLRTFDQRNADIVCGRPADELGQSINGRFINHPLWVRKEQVFVSQTEWLLFFRREALIKAGLFDENIGLGASSPWQSAEGQDLTLYALERGCRIYYDPGLIGHHPKYDIISPDKRMLSRALMYGRGMGYVVAKHRFSAVTLLKILMRPLLGALTYSLQFNPKRAQYYLLSAVGRFEGYLGGRKSLKTRSV